MLDARHLLALAGICGAGCGSKPAPPAALASEVVVAPIAAPEVQCPAGSRRAGNACVATEVSCPPGSKRVDDRCVGEVHCDIGMSWDGKACKPAEPEPAAGMRTCTLFAMSTPWADVFVDGKRVGVTPLSIKVVVGSHIASFVNGSSRRNVTFECQTDQVHKVVVQLTP